MILKKAYDSSATPSLDPAPSDSRNRSPSSNRERLNIIIMFKRSLFDDGLRFRESLGAGSRLGVAEESYAFFRIIGQGQAVAYVPDAIVRHDEPILPEEREARESAYRRGLAAYLFLLLVEEPRFRRRTVKYIIESIRHPPGAWRAHPAKRSSRLRLALAACAGPA